MPLCKAREHWAIVVRRTSRANCAPSFFSSLPLTTPLAYPCVCWCVQSPSGPAGSVVHSVSLLVLSSTGTVEQSKASNTRLDIQRSEPYARLADLIGCLFIDLALIWDENSQSLVRESLSFPVSSWFHRGALAGDDEFDNNSQFNSSPALSSYGSTITSNFLGTTLPAYRYQFTFDCRFRARSVEVEKTFHPALHLGVLGKLAHATLAQLSPKYDIPSAIDQVIADDSTVHPEAQRPRHSSSSSIIVDKEVPALIIEKKDQPITLGKRSRKLTTKVVPGPVTSTRVTRSAMAIEANHATEDVANASSEDEEEDVANASSEDEEEAMPPKRARSKPEASSSTSAKSAKKCGGSMKSKAAVKRARGNRNIPRTLEQRKRDLEASEWCDQVTPSSARCLGCMNAQQLDDRSTVIKPYQDSNWLRHSGQQSRRMCKELLSRLLTELSASSGHAARKEMDEWAGKQSFCGISEKAWVTKRNSIRASYVADAAAGAL